MSCRCFEGHVCNYFCRDNVHSDLAYLEGGWRHTNDIAKIQGIQRRLREFGCARHVVLDVAPAREAQPHYERYGPTGSFDASDYPLVYRVTYREDTTP